MEKKKGEIAEKVVIHRRATFRLQILQIDQKIKTI